MFPLKDIFRTNCFLIPENQRAFSWRRQQAEALVRDLNLMGTQSHYLGPIIVSQSGRANFRDAQTRDWVREYVLEDGQQRLTTFLLFIHALVKRFAALGQPTNQHAVELAQLIQYESEGHHLRIRNSNPDLDQFMRHLIADAPEPAQKTAPMTALQEVSDYLGRTAATLDLEQAIEWKMRLTAQAKFILVDLSQDDIDRYLAFDAINSRGLPLTEFEKIKNFCALLVRRRSLQFHPEVEWYKALVELQRFDASDRREECMFISEAHSIFFGQKVGLDKVHADFVRRFEALLTKANPNLERRLEQYVAFWQPYASAFGFLFCSERKTIDPHRISISSAEWLTYIDNLGLPTISRPILATSLLKYNRQDFERVARWAEIYTFRVHALAGRRTDANKQPIITLAHEIYFQGKCADEVGGVICAWLQDLAPLTRAVAFLANGEPKYNFDGKVRGWSHAYYFLYQYELSVSPTAVRAISYRKNREEQRATIEHILPQTHRDGGWWEREWPDGALADIWKHRLGNLVLTSNNPALGQKSFPQKLSSLPPEYSYTSPHANNGEKQLSRFGQGKHWGPRELLQREVALMQFALERWVVPCEGDNSTYVLPSVFAEQGDGGGVVALSRKAGDCIRPAASGREQAEEENEDDADESPEPSGASAASEDNPIPNQTEDIQV